MSGSVIGRLLKRVVIVKIMKYKIISYDSICSMCCGQKHFCYSSLLAILRKKRCEPRKEIEILNRFEYRYLNDLKVPYFLCLSFIIHKGYLHGHNSHPILKGISEHVPLGHRAQVRTDSGSKCKSLHCIVVNQVYSSNYKSFQNIVSIK